MQAKRLGNVFFGATVAAAAVFGCWQLIQRPEAIQPVPPPAQAEISPPVTLPPATLPPEPTAAPDPFIHQRQVLAQAARGMNAEHIFVYDCGARDMLFSSTDPQAPVYPASITKLFSAWVALQWLEPEAVITVGDELELVQKGSSLAYLQKGHKLTASMLVEAMLLPSGNDAAYVLAAAAGRAIANDPGLTGYRAVEVFVEELNRQGAQAGLKNTHFANPDGYHQESHVSTPEDLAKMGALVLDEPLICHYSVLPFDAVTFASGQTITWHNTNRLAVPEDPYNASNFLVGKTGYTSQAGCCLMAVFQVEGRQLLVGIFGAETRHSRYGYAHALLDALT